MRASPIQTSFNAGEWSPLMGARVDLDGYRNSLALCRNFVPLVQGGLSRRPGTVFVDEANSTGLTAQQMRQARLVPFEFSTVQAYVLEFTHEKLKFYTQNGVLLDGGNPLIIDSPYEADDIPGLYWAQSADVLYITARGRAPRRLLRTGATDWAFDTPAFVDGPYGEINLDDDLTLAFDGTDTITATAGVFSAENPAVGSPIRIFDETIGVGDSSVDIPGEWRWFSVTEVVSGTVVKVTNPQNADAIAATREWRLGAWYPGNYPTSVIFYEGRLWFAGAPQEPQRIDGSTIGEFLNFGPTDPDGSINPDNAVAIVLNSDKVNAVQWLSADERGLLVGTQGAEWILRRLSGQEPLFGANIQAVSPTAYGSARRRPLRIGNVTMFVQRDTRTLRELTYVFEADGFRAPDMSLLADHLVASGIGQMVYQQAPQKTIWAADEAGRLRSLTYERDQEVVGWSRHELGGQVRIIGMATIPSPDSLTDQLWLLVERDIGDQPRFYVERLTPLWESGDEQTTAFFVDSGLMYEGDPITTVTGLEHLEGETVQILADGAVHPSREVSGGQISLDYEASTLVVGLGYDSEALTQRIEAGAADGTAQGKTKRIHRVVFRFFETLGATVGPDKETTQPIIFRSTADDMGAAVPLFTGDKFVDWEGDYDREGRVYVAQHQPLPMTVLAIMPQLMTQDGG